MTDSETTKITEQGMVLDTAAMIEAIIALRLYRMNGGGEACNESAKVQQLKTQFGDPINVVGEQALAEFETDIEAAINEGVDLAINAEQAITVAAACHYASDYIRADAVDSITSRVLALTKVES